VGAGGGGWDLLAAAGQPLLERWERLVRGQAVAAQTRGGNLIGQSREGKVPCPGVEGME